MSIKKIVILFLILGVISSEGQADEASEDIGTNQGFHTLDTSIYKVASETTIKNMPPFYSQDTIGMCTEFTAKVAIEFEYCKAHGLSCSNLPLNQQVSSLYLGTLPKMKSKDAEKSFGFADAHVLVGRAIQDGIVGSEACSRFDQVAAKIGTSPEHLNEAQKIAWNKLKSTWGDYQKLDKSCISCQSFFTSSEISGDDGIISLLGLKKSPQEVLKAFSSSSFEALVEELFVPYDCAAKGIDVPDGMGIEYHPKEGSKSNYPATIAVIKDKIKAQKPIMVADYCADNKKMREITDKNCEGKHNFVISGYREVCKDPKGHRGCVDMVQVHNSWGESWQRDNDDGWVQAKFLLDRTFYTSQSLGWITP